MSSALGRLLAFVTAVVLGVAALPLTARAAPPTEEQPKRTQPRVVLLPLGVVGTLPDPVREELSQRVERALQAEGREVAVAPPDPERPDPTGTCFEPRCWKTMAGDYDADYLVAVRVEAEDPDYLVQVELHAGDTGDKVAVAEDRCDLCGRTELAELVSDLTTTVRRRISAQAAPLPVLIVASEPVGADVVLDGTPVGRTPVRMTAPAGEHRIEVRAEGHRPKWSKVSLVDGVTERVSLTLEPVPIADEAEHKPRAGRGLMIGGATSVGVGAGALAAGIALLVIHGRPIRSQCNGTNVDAMGRCRWLHDTQTPGIVVTAIGSVAIVAGLSLIAAAIKRNRGRERHKREVPAVSIVPSGFGLAGRF